MKIIRIKKFAIYAIKNLVLMMKTNNYYKAKNCCKSTGKYQGICHKICKIRYATLKEVPIYFTMVLTLTITLL